LPARPKQSEGGFRDLGPNVREILNPSQGGQASSELRKVKGKYDL